MNRQMSVSQLSRYLKGVFDDEELLHDVTLTGEVSDVSYSDKHTFLVLSEGAYSVRCAHFFSRDGVEKGSKVALRGSVGFYEKRNNVSFTYTEYFVSGRGDKNAKLEALKNKLRELGYFENRPQLPKYIVSVAAVTSPDGAAIRDFMRVVHDKNPFVSIKVYPVKVQGDGAAAQMARAIAALQRSKFDAIVLCRGGGSDEDLDSFNDENLAIAVAESEIPIISAVGHEINFSLCDFCAGTRAGTPSIAGEIVNSRASAISDDIIAAIAAIKSRVMFKLEREAMRINRLGKATTNAVLARVERSRNALRLAAGKGVYSLQTRLAGRARGVCAAAQRLKAAESIFLAQKQALTDRLCATLAALDPHRIIKIGYAVVKKQGERVFGSSELDVGDDIGILFSDGEAQARITAIKLQ